MSTVVMGSVLMESENVLDAINNDSVCIMDARKHEEYVRGHLPQALSFPLWDLLKDDSPETVAKMAGKAGIDGKTPVVIYDDMFGAIASRVGWTLERAGHESVFLLDKTYSDWKKSGFPIETQTKKKPKPVPFIPTIPCNEKGVSLSDVESSPTEVVLIDNRERLNFLESHIPGAVNIPYPMLHGQNSILRHPEELKRIFANRGITEESKIITYCGSAGTLSGLAYYALKHAGISNVRLYSKSFREWKENKKPVEVQQDANYWDLSAE